MPARVELGLRDLEPPPVGGDRPAQDPAADVADREAALPPAADRRVAEFELGLRELEARQPRGRRDALRVRLARLRLDDLVDLLPPQLKLAALRDEVLVLLG